MVRKILLIGLLVINITKCYSQVRDFDIYRPARIHNGLHVGVDGIKIDSIILSGDTLFTYTNGSSTPFKSLYNTNNPGGAAGDIQYNNTGSFDGAPLTTDGTNVYAENSLSVGDTTFTRRIHVFGDGIVYQGGAGHEFQRYSSGAWETVLLLSGGIANFNHIIQTQSLSSAPTYPIIPANGMMYYNTTSNTFEFRQNNTWVSLSPADSSWVSADVENLKTFYIELNDGSPLATKYVDSNSFYFGDNDLTIMNLNSGSYPDAFYVQKKYSFSSNVGMLKIDGNGYNVSATDNLTYPIIQIVGNSNYHRINALIDGSNGAVLEVNKNRTISLTNTTSDEDNSMSFDQTSLVLNYDYDGVGNNVDYFEIDTVGVVFKGGSRQTTAMVTDGDTALFNETNGSIVKHIKSQTITLDTSTQSHSEGTIYYNSEKKGSIDFNDISGFDHNIGYEVVRRVYNNTGSTIVNGRFVRRTGTHTNDARVATIALAGISSEDSTNVWGITTVDIPPSEYGVATAFGDVGGVNNSTLSEDRFYCGFAGVPIDTAPPPPYYTICGGEVEYSDNDSGIYAVNIELPTFTPSPLLSVDTSGLNQVVTITTQDIYEYLPISDCNVDANYGFTIVGDSIQVGVSGYYQIVLSMSFQGNPTTEVWHYTIFKNNIAFPYKERSTGSSATGDANHPLSRRLEKDDWVSFRIKNTSGTGTPTIQTIAVQILFLHE